MYMYKYAKNRLERNLYKFVYIFLFFQESVFRTQYFIHTFSKNKIETELKLSEKNIFLY